MRQPYVAPMHGQSAFNCSHCNAYAKQNFFDARHANPAPKYVDIPALSVSWCTHCNRYAIWYEKKLLVPPHSTAPSPHPDLPSSIAADYNEARAIASTSPRGAAALLRLCIQKLCVHFGEPGKDLNTDISSLVKKGLHPSIQKSLDIVRVVGNEAVHPGTMDLNDQSETALQLFNLVNIIVETLITQPKAIQTLYESLPGTKREQIKQRDNIK